MGNGDVFDEDASVFVEVPKVMASKHSSEVGVDVSPPIACHGGTRGSSFGLRRMQNSTVNARDNRFILVRALDHDRVIALHPVGVSLCVGLIVKCCVVFFSIYLGTPPSFI